MSAHTCKFPQTTEVIHRKTGKRYYIELCPCMGLKLENTGEPAYLYVPIEGVNKDPGMLRVPSTEMWVRGQADMEEEVRFHVAEDWTVNLIEKGELKVVVIREEERVEQLPSAQPYPRYLIRPKPAESEYQIQVSGLIEVVDFQPPQRQHHPRARATVFAKMIQLSTPAKMSDVAGDNPADLAIDLTLLNGTRTTILFNQDVRMGYEACGSSHEAEDFVLDAMKCFERGERYARAYVRIRSGASQALDLSRPALDGWHTLKLMIIGVAKYPGEDLVFVQAKVEE